jgi:hypothetical protein
LKDLFPGKICKILKDQILAIENLKKHLIVALLVFNFSFWQHIARRKQKGKQRKEKKKLVEILL